MKIFLALALAIVCLSSYAHALAQIACVPEICLNMKCAAIPLECRSPDSGFRVLPHGGICGCCALCVKVLEENEPCQALNLRGVPQREICDDGLQCDKVRHVCVKEVTIPLGL